MWHTGLSPPAHHPHTHKHAHPVPTCNDVRWQSQPPCGAVTPGEQVTAPADARTVPPPAGHTEDLCEAAHRSTPAATKSIYHQQPWWAKVSDGSSMTRTPQRVSKPHLERAGNTPEGGRAPARARCCGHHRRLPTGVHCPLRCHSCHDKHRNTGRFCD